MYGLCYQCGFPILVNSNNPVSCPFCATLNQPITASVSPTSIFVGVAVLIGVMVLSKAKVGV